jgi:hypothetical protein
MAQTEPAVGAPLERHVRPPAKVFAYWAQSVHGRVFSEMPGGMGLVWHPLYEHEELRGCERSLTLAMRQWDTWKAYALELQARLVKYEGGSLTWELNGGRRPSVRATG